MCTHPLAGVRARHDSGGPRTRLHIVPSSIASAVHILSCSLAGGVAPSGGTGLGSTELVPRRRSRC
jgi:hypothetical protein